MQRIFGRVLGILVLATAIMAPAFSAAQKPAKTLQAAPPELDFSFTYAATDATQIGSKGFWMQGGAAEIHGRFYGSWGVVADIAGAHNANVNSTGVELNVITATFGPRYTWSPAHARYEFFGQGLVGLANGFNSVFPNTYGAQTAASSLAVKTGGGVDIALAPHLAFRAIEADWLRTQLPNSTGNVQNNFTLGAGIVLRCR